MTEIEQAIKSFERFKEASYSHSFLPSSWSIELALSALREQAEREKGCVWCRGDNQVTHNGEHFCFFCSYCGKRLEVEP